MFMSKSGSLYIQKRGFRTRKYASTGLSSGHAPDEKRSSLLSFLSDQARKVVGIDKAKVEAKASTSFSGQPPEEQQRLKVAFAEGYVASHQQQQGKPSSDKYVVLKRFFWIGLVGFVLYYTFLSETTFRIRFSGNQNEVSPEEVNVTFNDVRGIDEAKDEVMEIVEYLREPAKFSRLGGRLPKGVLLVGPPGTGKTLLARAIAGEANVPFFHASGSEFDEVLVGQGARRVRDLFATAKAKAPCVVFIDEIDSVGSKRTSSALHPYANQTINQLLAEMDGFRQNEGVIVLGATNRKDDLDKALLRPGRFDVEVFVTVPDLKGRREILDLYLGKVKHSSDVDNETLARGTTGFTGADIENMVNQAALRAAADGMPDVNMAYLENARDKVLMGPEKKGRIPDAEVVKNTAYHESGHVLVAYFTKGAQPLHKVTIIPRGQSLGHTASIPERDMYQVTRAELLAQLDTLMGGRVAEELIFGVEHITTGASDDLRKATAIATEMVKRFGMSDKVGLRTFDDSDRSAIVVVSEMSAATSDAVDSEVKRLLTEAYDRAKSILKMYALAHKRLADALLEFETLDAKEIRDVIEGRPVIRPPLISVPTKRR